MAIFVILIIVSLAFYVFYKIKALQAKQRPYEKSWVNAKGSIALGLAMVFFGIDELILTPKTAIIIISAVLIIVGGYFVYQNFRIYRYFTPLATREANDAKKED